jgi:hypothetical protein
MRILKLYAAVSAALPKRTLAPSFPPSSRPLGGHQDAVVAQLVRAPVCGTGGRWFEPTQLYQPSTPQLAGRCLEPLMS